MKSYKYKFYLSNLNCANCAHKIEVLLNNEIDVTSANVNFAKLTLLLETTLSEKNIKRKISKIVESIDPDVKVLSDNEEQDDKLIFDLVRLGLGILFVCLALIFHEKIINQVFVLLAYVILLFRTCKKSLKMLLKGFNIDENLLVTISCIGAYLTNNIHEGLMVIILYEIGKILEQKAVNNSRESISDLMDIKPLYANLIEGEEVKQIKPELVKVGDLILIKKGEKIPLDGVVVEGKSKIDNKALTGESRLQSVDVNDEVLSGSINTLNVIVLKVTKLYEDSTVSQILDLVENASDKKAKTENFVSKAAKIYTPIVLILAILIALVLPLFQISFADAIYRALVFLVVSCPCAMAISVPLSYFSGIGASSKKGILIKGSNYLEKVSKIEEIIFDKTGTITEGDSYSYDLKILDSKYSKEKIIKYYVSGEKFSNHPIALAIMKKYAKNVKCFQINNFEEISGLGLKYNVNNIEVKIGSTNFCQDNNNDNAICLCLNDKLVAKLYIVDKIKNEAINTIVFLKKKGIKVKMFTGDNKDIALNIANKVGIDEVQYELLPKDKFKLLEKDLEKYNGKVAFVGDGINDAPALRIAGVGISMGGIGSASAIEASDIVIMNDNLDSLLTLWKISLKTNKIVKQNLLFAMGIKILVLLLSGLGIATMWQAVFADTGLTLLTILNTTRIFKK